MSISRKLMQTQPTAGEGVWTLTNAIEQYDSIVYQTSSTLPTNITTGFFFKPDGTKLYTVNASTAYEFDLSTDWNVETATLVQSKSISPE